MTRKRPQHLSTWRWWWRELLSDLRRRVDTVGGDWRGSYNALDVRAIVDSLSAVNRHNKLGKELGRIDKISFRLRDNNLGIAANDDRRFQNGTRIPRLCRSRRFVWRDFNVVDDACLDTQGGHATCGKRLFWRVFNIIIGLSLAFEITLVEKDPHTLLWVRSEHIRRLSMLTLLRMCVELWRK
jgi:hypothetical protein